MKVADLFRLPHVNSTDLRRANVDILLGKNAASLVIKNGQAIAVLIRFDDMVDIVAGIQARAIAEKEKALLPQIECVPTIVKEAPYVSPQP